MTGRRNPSDLDPEFIISAYCSGYFPMAESLTGRISWYSPDPRAILPLAGFRVSRSLRQKLRKNLFDVRINTAFREVIAACAGRSETWISPEIIRAYTALHAMGFAHSVEAWRDDRLAGGLYGVAIAGAFFGESMFTRETDASKVALVHLVERLRTRGFVLLDTQFVNDHVRQFGACEVPRSEYLGMLAAALSAKTSFLDTAPTLRRPGRKSP